MAESLTSIETKAETIIPAQSEIHLCNNARHLLFALGDISKRNVAATLIYLEDENPLGSDTVGRIARHFPDLEVHLINDKDQIRSFQSLPNFFPPIFRRNLRHVGARFILATQWELPVIRGRTFETGYVYHPGLFSSKSLSTSCKSVIMRESGLNNYVTLAVPPLKSVIRWMRGLPAWSQVWGEEKWINSIEVSNPDGLPDILRSKARKLAFADIMDALSTQAGDALVDIFAPDFEKPELTEGRNVLMLTQPLDKVGLCTEARKIGIYNRISTFLRDRGFTVHVKYHPSETPFQVEDAKQLSADFPLELWPLLGCRKFDLAIALCSASLSEENPSIANTSIQLMKPSEFNADGVAIYYATMDERLGRQPV